MKKTYQIDKQRAAQQFGKQAGATNQQLQFALPLPEVVAWVGALTSISGDDPVP